MLYYLEETIPSPLPVDCVLNLPKDSVTEKIVNDILNPCRRVYVVVQNGSFDYKFNLDRLRYN